VRNERPAAIADCQTKLDDPTGGGAVLFAVCRGKVRQASTAAGSSVSLHRLLTCVSQLTGLECCAVCVALTSATGQVAALSSQACLCVAYL
jgi:hypothetical protein